MNTDTIIANIENFFNTASPEAVAKIQKVLNTPSENDAVLGAYFDSICEEFLLDEELNTSRSYTSNSIILDEYIFTYENFDSGNTQFQYSESLLMDSENCDTILQQINIAA